jgi:septin family protein
MLIFLHYEENLKSGHLIQLQLANYVIRESLFNVNFNPKVNIIPVIGKADCCTKQEILQFKKKVNNYK